MFAGQQRREIAGRPDAHTNGVRETRRGTISLAVYICSKRASNGVEIGYTPDAASEHRKFDECLHGPSTVVRKREEPLLSRRNEDIRVQLQDNTGAKQRKSGTGDCLHRESISTDTDHESAVRESGRTGTALRVAGYLAA